MRGWSINPNLDDYNLRSLSIIDSELDINGVAESHLQGNNILNIEGYNGYGNNRQNIHVNARTGSGGVGFLIKKRTFNEFNVPVLKNS